MEQNAEDMTASDDKSEQQQQQQQQQLVLSEVKSTAVVKYANIETPARFQELQRNTNLNNPPSNWHGNWDDYIQKVSVHRERSPFSSFNMAHCYPDLAGEIDVVSDSENIKKLLKIAYSRSNVSMMVHRVGNTLMLDEFDIHRYLLRQQDDDWKWLRQFFHDTVLHNMKQNLRDKYVVAKTKSIEQSQSRNMFSKFLYYSMAGETETETETATSAAETDLDASSDLDSSIDSLHSSPVHKPNDEDDSQFGATKMITADHQRTVVWTFEDIRMLIGTDLPIFGGNSHPCVSLRLREMGKPINVLTGIDYWLDNLMCNVPELAMCYHLNGIVERYELIKTEEIPNLENSSFSPRVVKDVAQNILSFLKSNATKEGHTYWLFKGHDDDVIKLYDLTTLCSSLSDDETTNPFTVPVGVLLYRVARNMRLRSGRHKLNVVRALLENCLTLLDPIKHSQLVTSAHYLLSDLYTADDVETSCEQTNDDSDDQTERTSESGETVRDESEETSDVSDTDRDETSHSALTERCETPGAGQQSNVTPTGELSDGQGSEAQHDSPQGNDSVSDSRGTDSVSDARGSDTVSDPRGTDSVSDARGSDTVSDSQGSDTVSDSAGEICVPVKALCVHEKSKKSKYDDQSLKYPPITGSTEQRCYDSITHIIQGLRSIHEHTRLVTMAAGPTDDMLLHCDPSKAIPLHYHPLHEHNSSTLPADSPPTLPPDVDMPACTGITHLQQEDQGSQGSQGPPATHHVCRADDSPPLDTMTGGASWCQVLKALLIRKATIVCYKLAREKQNSQSYGLAIMFTRQALYCFAAMKRAMPSKADENIDLLSSILSLCGDIELSLARCSTTELQPHREALKTWPIETAQMMDLLIDEPVASGYESILDIDEILNREVFLKRSIEAYQSALNMLPPSKQNIESLETVQKRLGNAFNELGVYFMNQAAQFLNNEEMSFTETQKLCSKSLEYFDHGISVFSSINDVVNQAMLYSNKGRLMRLLAQCVVFTGKTAEKPREFTPEERNYYNQAASSYKLALNLLSNCPRHDSMVDSLLMSMSWDLSSVYFTMATLLQDYSPISTMAQQQIEAEVIKLMKDALVYCDMSLNVQTAHLQLTIQYRKATINHRLASLYHNIVRMESSSDRRKKCRQEAEFHYSMAYREFINLVDGCSLEPLRVQLERLMLHDYKFNDQTTAVNKLKTMESALDLVVDCQVPLRALIAQLEDDAGNATAACDTASCDTVAESKTLQSEAVKLLSMLDSRLSTVLLNLLKNANVVYKNTASSAAVLDAYKAMYAVCLKSSVSPPPEPLQRCQQQLTVLLQVAQHKQQITKTAATAAAKN